MSVTGARFKQLHLIAPRPPDEEPKYTAQYLSLAMTVTGIRNLDLAAALRKVTAGDRFSYVPVSRSLHSGFIASGLPFAIHWPPVTLPERVAGEVRTAMRRYADLSRELLNRGNTSLYNNLRRARHFEWPDTEPYNSRRIVREPDLQHQRDAIDLDWEDEQAVPDFPEIETLDLPDDLKERFRLAWDSFRRANNNMSVIFDERQDFSLVVFGDAGKSVLRWLADKGDLAPRYDVMLAPHHGTQALPENFDVDADVCISQNGSRRGYLWPRHVDTHHSPDSCTTTQSGNHHILAGCSRGITSKD